MAIFCINESDVAWSNYQGGDGPCGIRFKALTRDAVGVPGVQFIEYGAGETDPVHQHDVGEFFIVMEGEMWLDDAKLEAGGVVFVPAHTDYAVRAGRDGVRYFRIVTG